MFSLARALPSPISVEDCSSLFDRFTGTMAQSDSSEVYLSAVWRNAFSEPISTLVESRSLRDLPVLVHVVSLRARVLRLRRADLPLAIARQAVLPSRLGRRSASLVQSLFEAQ